MEKKHIYGAVFIGLSLLAFSEGFFGFRLNLPEIIEVAWGISIPVFLALWVGTKKEKQEEA